jgi:hypothetical protein
MVAFSNPWLSGLLKLMQPLPPPTQSWKAKIVILYKTILLSINFWFIQHLVFPARTNVVEVDATVTTSNTIMEC